MFAGKGQRKEGGKKRLGGRCAVSRSGLGWRVSDHDFWDAIFFLKGEHVFRELADVEVVLLDVFPLLPQRIHHDGARRFFDGFKHNKQVRQERMRVRAREQVGNKLK